MVAYRSKNWRHSQLVCSVKARAIFDQNFRQFSMPIGYGQSEGRRAVYIAGFYGRRVLCVLQQKFHDLGVAVHRAQVDWRVPRINVAIWLYIGALKTGHVTFLNGRREVGCQLVRLLNVFFCF